MMKGDWITCEGCDAPWVVGQFHTHLPRAAMISISGLGFFECYLNGQKVSDDLLTPVWTDYAPRDGQRFRYPLDDHMRHRVACCVWDVLPYLREGGNELSVLLGNGWYSQRERTAEGDMCYGPQPILRFEMTWKDAEGEHTLCSGEQVMWRPSQIIRNNVYFGETRDLTLPKAPLRPVTVIPGPDCEPQPLRCPADRIIRELTPVLVGERDGLRVYDAGETVTGWAALTCAGAPGEEIIIQYAETLGDDGLMDFASCGRHQVQTDRYICSGQPTACRPHFTWHGFRYLSVRGPAEKLTVQVVHAAVAVTAAFRCSHDTLNWLFDAYVRTRLGNMHCGVPSDCPHRERLGYTGDGQAVVMTDMYLLDADAFYRKWIQDILDGQDPVTGHVQHTAPFYGGGGGPGGWGGAVVLVPWAHYQRYGDLALLRQTYPAMVKWVQYMISRMDERGAVVREELRGWCLGDWCAPEPVALPESFVNTCYLARCLGVMTQIAALLGEEHDALNRLLHKTRETIHTLWWDGGHYAGGVQGGDALALEAGVPETDALAEGLNQHYRRQPWFDTGFLATGSVVRQLFAHGHADTALALLTSDKPGHSFGWQRLQGADTLWERWSGEESRNHPMFGSVVACLFEGLMGISLQDSLTLRPVFPSALDHAACSVETASGRVRLRWERRADGILAEISLPAPGCLIAAGISMPLQAGTTQTLLPLP